MNGHKQSGVKANRIYRTIKVSPTTRAIRGALAASATLLALAGSGAALAGTCAITGLSEVTCSGVFTDSVEGTVPVINLVPDLTLVLDDTVVVNTDPGETGVSSTWGGDATVISYGEINTEGNDGIYMDSDGTGTVLNYGSIYTYVTGDGQSAIEVNADYDVTIVNGGDVSAASNAGYSVVAVSAYSEYGTASVTNQAGGSITASSYSGNAVGVDVESYYDATVDNAGTISASSFTDSAIGAVAESKYGEATVDNSGSIYAYSLTGTTAAAAAVSIFGDATVVNSGGMYSGGNGDAYGVYAISVFGTATVYNSGTIEVTSYQNDATGVLAYGKYADIDSSGDISVAGYTSATGIAAYGTYGANISNTGTLTVAAYGYGADAAGIAVEGSGYINVYNNGTISVTSTGDGSGPATLLPYSEGADGVGISAISYYEGGNETLTAFVLYGPNDVNVINGPAGVIYVNVGGNGTGMYGATFGAGSVYMDNQGSVGVYAGGSALGMGAYSDSGTIEVQNSGSVTAGALFGTAYGIEAETTSAYGNITVNNSGSVDAYTVFDYARGVSATTSGYDADIAIDNSGSISAYSYYYSAYGVLALASGDFSDVSVYSSGGIAAASIYGSAVGIGAVALGYAADAYVGTGVGSYITTYSYDSTSIGVVAAAKYSGDATLVNAGSINASSVTGTAAGFQVLAAGGYGDVYVNNSGSISAGSYGFGIGGIALSVGYDSDIAVYNSGSIYAYGGLQAIGLVVSSKYDESQVLVDNSGSIGAYSYGGIAAGLMVVTPGFDSDIAINNSGDISATAINGYATGVLAQSLGDYADIYLYSSGSVSAYSYFSGATGILVTAAGYLSDIYVNNSGSVSAESVYDTATGIYAINDYDSGYITIVNSGDVSATAYGDATGIDALGYGYGDTFVDSSGSITATSAYYDATGINAYAYYGDVYVYNSGPINVTAYDDAAGINAYSYGNGNVFVYNSGDIDVTSQYDDAVGIYAGANGSGDVTVYNSGSITVSAYDNAYGIYAEAADGGDVWVDNSGSIYVTSYDDADGIYTYADGGGDNTMINSGSITVSAYDNATGIRGNTNGGAYALMSVYNSGSIDVTSTYGYAEGVYVDANEYGADILVDNSGSITVNGYFGAVGIRTDHDNYAATTVLNSGSIDVYGYDGDATGIWTRTDGNSNYSSTTIDNSGSITAVSYFDEAVGINAYAGGYGGGYYASFGNFTSIDITNSGSISASSTYDSAIGITAETGGNYTSIEIDNSGTIDASGYGFAVGVFANSNGAYGNVISAVNSGDITAYAAGYGVAVTGVLLDSDSLYFDNSGSIYASAVGEYGFASGVSLYGYYGFNAYNSGDISASFSGPYGSAYGLYATSSGDGYIGIFNSGTISATADNYAFAVTVDTDSYSYIYNSGTIEASGAAYNVAVWSQGDSSDIIYNYGTINGALWMGDGNDFLYNADGAVWNVGQTPTYFGNGDDVILNYGTINMDDSVIDLGYHAVDGNYFYNFGTITIEGDNWIHMGHGPYAVIPSLNPNPFYNGGTLDFQDGAPNDYLLITGDFAGDGDINVDVSGLNETSDILYIDGSVVTGTVGVINVDLLDLPNTIETLIPIVYVTGVSVDGNFVLGDINWDEDNTFVTLDFGIVSDIDATNATPDVFSLGIEVTGLSDPGTLAASIPGSVISLMNTQVGTWRQRMGVIDGFSKGAVALWARVFQDKGSFSPEHGALNFGNGGNFEWQQRNSGVEAGIDFSVTDEFSLGLLVSKSEADIDLDNPGVGASELDADTWGVYGTWISPNGFYLDASYRWMNFDVDLNSVAGEMRAKGDAESFNIEVGYAWTLSGGLKIEPQLQYTKTNVDNIDVVSTVNGMSFRNDGGDSSRGRVGVAIRKSFGDADTGWLWTPYATLSAVREFDGESEYAINNTFFGATSIEGTSTLLEVGFTARHQNWSIYGGLNWQDGGAMNSFFGGQLGVRYTFGGSAPPPAPVAPPPAKTCAELDDDGDGVNNCDDRCLGSPAGEAVGPDGCPVPAPQPEPVMEPKPYRG